jgi:hypothetical protein
LMALPDRHIIIHNVLHGIPETWESGVSRAVLILAKPGMLSAAESAKFIGVQ